MGLREKLNQLFGTPQEYPEYHVPTAQMSGLASRAADAIKRRKLANFALPEHMDRMDWDVVVQFLKNYIAPPLDEEGMNWFVGYYQLCDKVIHDAVNRGGTVYFPVDRISHDSVVNVAMQIATGDELKALCVILVQLIFMALIWDFPDSDNLRMNLMDLWDLTQSGELMNSGGEWVDYGKGHPIELTIPRYIKVIPKDIAVQSPSPKVTVNNNQTAQPKPHAATGDTTDNFW